MNKKIKIVLLVILLLIPTYIAIAEFQKAQSPQVEDKRGVTGMTVASPDGTRYSYDAGTEEGDEAIGFMTSLNRNARKLESMPNVLSEASLFTVDYKSFAKTNTYRYYFTNDPDAAYLLDPEDKAYKITAADATSFLCREFSTSLYTGAVSPTLTIAGEEVIPQTMDWKYQLFDGTYRSVDIQTTSSQLTYRMNARLSMSFSIDPDVFNIEVFDGDTRLYSGNYAGLSALTVSETKLLRFRIEAKWYEIDGKLGQGEGVYDFMGRVNAPASFYLNISSCSQGDFCIITAKDKPEDSDITFVSEPDLGYTPVFVEDGEYYRALVPVKTTAPAGNYTFTLSCDGVVQQLSLLVNAKEFLDVNYNISESVVAATRTEATLASFDETMTPVAKSLKIAADHLFDGVWIEGVPEGAQLFTGFGRYRLINKGEATRYQHMGVDYYLMEGSEIQAVNNGVVIYVGSTDLSGLTVVVEHGLGLKSWYCHLSESKVQVGDSVKKGDVIALSGETGFCSQGQVHIGLSVFDVPVCPYDLWENPLVLNNP